MIALGRGVPVFAYAEVVDMRKSFDTLGAIVREHMKKEVLDGALFVFVGRDRRRAKVLFWDGTGPLRSREAARERPLRGAVGEEEERQRSSGRRASSRYFSRAVSTSDASPLSPPVVEARRARRVVHLTDARLSSISFNADACSRDLDSS